MKPLYRRVLIKLSGEGLAGSLGYGIDHDKLSIIVQEIKTVHALGVELVLVVGGGNIFRGAGSGKLAIDRATGDHMGMLATLINSLALQSVLEKEGIPTRVQSAIRSDTFCEPYIRRRALRHLEKGRVVVLACGTGNPYFTTDTGATLRAVELGCDVLMKATQVDGVYTADPKTHPDAVFIPYLSWQEVLDKNLNVMDVAAFAMARDELLSIVVFNMHGGQSLSQAVCGIGQFTIVGHRGMLS